MTGSGDFCCGPDDLAGWLEGTLDPRGRRMVAAHLAACDDCRRAAALAATLGSAPEVALDEALLGRVTAAARRRRAWRMPAAAAGVLAAAVLLFWIVRPRSSSEFAGAPVGVPPADTVRPEEPADRLPAVVVEKAPPAPPRPPPPEPVEAPPVKVEEPRTELVREPETPPERKEEAPPPKVEEQAPAAKTDAPGTTVADLSALYAPVFTVDPRGHLWVRRGRGEPSKAGAFENLAPTDSLCARGGGGGFTLEGRATVVLEKGAEAIFCYFKPERAYSVDVVQGLVMVDTEGMPQNWRAVRGATAIAFQSLNGRLAIEPRGGQLSALLLEGWGDLKAGGKTERMEPGREVVMSFDGRPVYRRGETRKKALRFNELRPKLSTSFEASFDDEGDAGPFSYEITAGRRAREGSAGFLRAESAEERGGRAVLAAGIRTTRPITFTTGLVLRFRYRTTFPTLAVRLDKFSAAFTAAGAASAGWVEGEMPVASFEQEGVPIVPLEEVSEVRFETAPGPKNNGRLDVDRIQFIRRAR